MKYRYVARNIREYNNTYYFTLSNGIKDGKQVIIRDKWRGLAGKTKSYNDKKAIEYYNEFYNENVQRQGNYYITFKDVVKEYTKVYITTKLKPNTQKNYINKIDKYILKEYASREVRTIKSLELHDYINGLNTSTIVKNKLVHILKGIFNYAVSQGYIKYNPTSYLFVIGADAGTETNKTDYIEMINDINEDIESIKRIFNKNRLIDNVVKVLLETGLRINELLCLTWEDVDFNKQEISINKSLNYIKGEYIVTTPKTARAKRKISISDPLFKILSDLKINNDTERNNKNLVLCTRTFNYINYCNVNDSFKRRLKGTKYNKIHIHSLRHLYTVLLIDNGVNIRTVSNILGHCNLNTTLNIYCNVTRKDIRDIKKCGLYSI